MSKYVVGQHIVSVTGKGSVYKVVLVDPYLYLLKVVSSKHLRIGAVKGVPKRIVESKTEPLIVEDNV